MIALPRHDTWIVNNAGLTRWRAQVDTIQITDLHDHGKILRLRLAGVESEIRLSPQEAAHIARLLRGA
jgi:hypothetical protein